ncbi:MAG TPA: DUF6159 family protein [Planctomycetota bacterium]|nr:DUF6159 family protein [Planctomycetota bacterium]
MFERISNSFALVRHSWAILKKDKEILVFPVLSGLSSMAAAASFIIPVFVLSHHEEMTHRDQRLAWYVMAFAFYLVSYFITIFFNVGVMTCASIRMDGGTPTLKDGFRGAFRNLGSILAWSFVAATVGMILRAVERRAGLIGRIVVSLLGAAWSMVTYFVVPVMIFEGAGVGRSIKRSGELFKKTWGEAVAGSGGMGFVFFCLAMLGLIPVAVSFWMVRKGAGGIALAVLGGAMTLGYWIALGVVAAALQGIFHVALFRYASTGRVPSDYPEELVARHWRPKA